MGTFSIFFYDRMLHVKDEANRIFRVLMVLISVIYTFFYLIMAAVAEYSVVSSQTLIELELGKWVATTPMMIYLICTLEEIVLSHTILLASLTVLTNASGYVAILCNNHDIFWCMLIFGSVCWAYSILSLLYRTFRFYSDRVTTRHMNNWVFTILVIGMTISWSTYPCVFILCHQGIIGVEAEICVYTVLDIINKGAFGAILIGAKEVEEGVESSLATFSRSITRVHPVTLEPAEPIGPVEIKVETPKPRRGSIYIYTPPASMKSMGAGSGNYSIANYSTGSHRALAMD
jgi:bacteriorhodopsin